MIQVIVDGARVAAKDQGRIAAEAPIIGEISLIGPANFIDLHPLIDFHVTKSLTLTTDWDFFGAKAPRMGFTDPPST
ncbi:MAG TPA: hypothetical protein VKK81_24070 [Candidatus Binatia bacterium]|nr:hypothetical protein [Candidatus Binatia bacterium]